MREYKVSDLFFTSWSQIPSAKIPVIYALQQQINNCQAEEQRYGYLLIMILRLLRRRPLLVDKLNVVQAVDIYNDLAFLNKPWFFFVKLKQLPTPEEYMARHSFDHFIYADNEFTTFLATNDKKYLRRLIATIYQDEFDKEAVEGLATKMTVKEWQENFVFYTFSHIREFVTNRCKNLLPKAAEGEQVEQPARQKATGAIWLKIKHRLAETPAFQGYETAGKANMYSALDYLEDLAKQKADAKP